MSEQHTSTGNPIIDAALRTGTPLSIETTMDGKPWPIAELDKRFAAIAAAERSIVDAADKHHDYLPHTVRVAVDHWRKLKGGA